MPTPNALPAQPEVFVRDFLPRKPEREDDVERIVRWSVRESMVAISPDSIRSHSFAKAAYDTNERLLGYGAITHIYSADVVELGGLVVSQASRGLGIASRLTRAIVQGATEAMSPAQIIAFSNTKSAPIFAKLGGKQIEDATTLPPEVWKVCHICRYYDAAQEAGATCCGRVYDITRIETDD